MHTMYIIRHAHKMRTQAHMHKQVSTRARRRESTRRHIHRCPHKRARVCGCLCTLAHASAAVQPREGGGSASRRKGTREVGEGGEGEREGGREGGKDGRTDGRTGYCKRRCKLLHTNANQAAGTRTRAHPTNCPPARPPIHPHKAAGMHGCGGAGGARAVRPPLHLLRLRRRPPNLPPLPQPNPRTRPHLLLSLPTFAHLHAHTHTYTRTDTLASYTRARTRSPRPRAGRGGRMCWSMRHCAAEFFAAPVRREQRLVLRGVFGVSGSAYSTHVSQDSPKSMFLQK